MVEKPRLGPVGVWLALLGTRPADEERAAVRALEEMGYGADGAHPYLTTPRHTARARAILGPAALLAPEQGFVLETDPAAARAAGRSHLAGYLQLPNYVNAWREDGFTDEDLADGGSDR